MDNETKNRIADYFDAYALVEFLGDRIKTIDIVDAFEEDIEDVLEEIEGEMGIQERNRYD